MYGDLNDCYGAPLQRELAEMNRMEQELIEAGNREAEAYYAEMAEREKNMRLIDANALEAELHAALREADDINGAYILNTLDAQKTVDAVPIKTISAWLAGYAIPPRYAMEAIGEPTITDETHRALAWEYHWKHLMEGGLLQEEQDG